MSRKTVRESSSSRDRISDRPSNAPNGPVAAGNARREKGRVAKEAEPDDSGPYGHSSLQEAIASGRASAVKTLLDLEADPNAPAGENGFTPVGFAVIARDPEIVELLLAGGAKVNAHDDNGFTALHMAAGIGHEKILRTLLDHGAAVDAGEASLGRTPLHYADSIRTVIVLLDAGADIDATDGNGETPLHAAIASSKTDIAAILLHFEASIEAPGEEGRTPLHYAAAEGGERMATLLLDAGAEVNARDDNGLTPLYTAGMFGNENIMGMLLDHGAEKVILDDTAAKSGPPGAS